MLELAFERFESGVTHSSQAIKGKFFSQSHSLSWDEALTLELAFESL
jgi:hypothetical protein